MLRYFFIDLGLKSKKLTQPQGQMVQRVLLRERPLSKEGYGSEQNSRFWINKKYEIGRRGHVGIQLIGEHGWKGWAFLSSGRILQKVKQ